MSLAVLFISMIREYAARVWSLLIGDIFLLTDSDVVLMLISTLVVLVVCTLFYREFLFISFDMEGAIAYGIRANLLNYVLLVLIAIAVVVTLRGVGAILVFAMFVAPAASAVEVSKNVRSVFILAFLIAITSGFAGLAISFFYPVSPGAMASLFASLTYFAVVVKKHI
jgi:ABC-type Mn2+/Zn2+ transport system permease subunit